MKPFKIHSKWVIKGKIWSVAYKWRLTNDKNEECDGLTVWPEQTIYLNRAATAEEKCQAFLHEFIHIILDEHHLHEEGGIASTFAEEVICGGVARAILESFTLKPREQHRTASRKE